MFLIKHKCVYVDNFYRRNTMSSITTLVEQFEAQIEIFEAEKETCEDNKASARRLRKATLEMTKIGKELRKATIENDKA